MLYMLLRLRCVLRHCELRACTQIPLPDAKMRQRVLRKALADVELDDT
jgi:hypothetical protein